MREGARRGGGKCCPGSLAPAAVLTLNEMLFLLVVLARALNIAHTTFGPIVDRCLRVETLRVTKCATHQQAVNSRDFGMKLLYMLGCKKIR